MYHDKQRNFSAIRLDKLPKLEKGKLNHFKDSVLKGLWLYVAYTGAITFYAQKRFGKAKKVQTIGQYPYITVAEARQYATKIIGEWIKKYKINKETPEELIPTLDELFKTWLKRYAKANKKSWEHDVNRYNNHFKRPFGNRKITDISKDQLIEHNIKIKNTKGLYAANRAYTLLKKIYKDAFDWGIITDLNHNPTLLIKEYKETSRERFIQPNELERFFSALAQEPNIEMRDFIFVALMTGARRANVLSMKWEAINLETNNWTIEETKNGQPLVVPLNAHVMKIINRRFENNKKIKSQWVFPRSDKPRKHITAPHRAWMRLKEKSGIQDIRIHDLRRSLGSWQAMTGVTTATIKKTLGHKNAVYTQVYERMNLDPVKAGIDKATGAMLQGVKQNVIDSLTS